MAFGTTNYPVFVEFKIAGDDLNDDYDIAWDVSISIDKINAVTPSRKGRNFTEIYLSGCGEDYTVYGTYSEVMQKINAKIPKPAKWPPTEGSKKNDHLPTRKENIQPQPVTTTGQDHTGQVSEHLSYDRSPAPLLSGILGSDLPRY